jgi:hypothetical protein
MRLPTSQMMNGPVSKKVQELTPRCWGFRFPTPMKTSSCTGWETIRSFVVLRYLLAIGAYLWTSGFVPRLDTYMGPETPNPIMVRVQRGECDLRGVLVDVMGLTKINFNSCLFNDRMPVTIRFANEVGDVLISAPMDGEPRLPFKFYI